MEKSRSTRIIAIAALVVAVVGLTIGFSSFSNSLRISSSSTVTPNMSDFSVDFSSNETVLSTDDISPTKNPDSIEATEAKIDNTGDPTISNLTAVFTEPGQNVSYTFYAANNGQYNAFLKSIIYANVTGESSFRVCTANQGTTDALVQAACDDISVSVKVGNEAVTKGTVNNIANHLLSKGSFEPIVVTMEYAENGDRADGDFSVAFGNITLEYSSVD